MVVTGWQKNLKWRQDNGRLGLELENVRFVPWRNLKLSHSCHGNPTRVTAYIKFKTLMLRLSQLLDAGCCCFVLVMSVWSAIRPASTALFVHLSESQQLRGKKNKLWVTWLPEANTGPSGASKCSEIQNIEENEENDGFSNSPFRISRTPFYFRTVKLCSSLPTLLTKSK